MMFILAMLAFAQADIVTMEYGFFSDSMCKQKTTSGFMCMGMNCAMTGNTVCQGMGMNGCTCSDTGSCSFSLDIDVDTAQVSGFCQALDMPQAQCTNVGVGNMGYTSNCKQLMGSSGGSTGGGKPTTGGGGSGAGKACACTWNDCSAEHAQCKAETAQGMHNGSMDDCWGNLFFGWMSSGLNCCGNTLISMDSGGDMAMLSGLVPGFQQCAFDDSKCMGDGSECGPLMATCSTIMNQQAQEDCFDREIFSGNHPDCCLAFLANSAPNGSGSGGASMMQNDGSPVCTAQELGMMQQEIQRLVRDPTSSAQVVSDAMVCLDGFNGVDIEVCDCMDALEYKMVANYKCRFDPSDYDSIYSLWHQCRYKGPGSGASCASCLWTSQDCVKEHMHCSAEVAAGGFFTFEDCMEDLFTNNRGKVSGCCLDYSEQWEYDTFQCNPDMSKCKGNGMDCTKEDAHCSAQANPEDCWHDLIIQGNISHCCAAYVEMEERSKIEQCSMTDLTDGIAMMTDLVAAQACKDWMNGDGTKDCDCMMGVDHVFAQQFHDCSPDGGSDSFFDIHNMCHGSVGPGPGHGSGGHMWGGMMCDPARAGDLITHVTGTRGARAAQSCTLYVGGDSNEQCNCLSAVDEQYAMQNLECYTDTQDEYTLLQKTMLCIHGEVSPAPDAVVNMYYYSTQSDCEMYDTTMALNMEAMDFNADQCTNEVWDMSQWGGYQKSSEKLTCITPGHVQSQSFMGFNCMTGGEMGTPEDYVQEQCWEEDGMYMFFQIVGGACDPNNVPVCCAAMTSQCMACSQGITEAEFCAKKRNKNVQGCAKPLKCKKRKNQTDCELYDGVVCHWGAKKNGKPTCLNGAAPPPDPCAVYTDKKTCKADKANSCKYNKKKGCSQKKSG